MLGEKNRNAIVFSRGFHGPWTMGEVTYSRNFVDILSRLYSEVKVLTSVDRKREEFTMPETGENVQVKYKDKDFKLDTGTNTENEFDYHFLNFSLLNFPGILIKGEKIYSYQFDPSFLRRGIPTRSSFLTLFGRVSSLTTLTTCIGSFPLFKKMGGDSHYYVPPPIPVPSFGSKKNRKNSGLIKILYLGHGRYSRFPYREIFNVLNRINKQGYNFEFEAYFSRLDYTNYSSFVESCRDKIQELNMGDQVTVSVKNLSEEEKFRKYEWSDLFLYPSQEIQNVDPPLSVLEAMSAGSCVVATPVTKSIPKLLENRGLILSGDSVRSSLYNRLKFLFENPDLVTKLGKNSKEYIARKHNAENVTRIMKSILNRNQLQV